MNKILFPLSFLLTASSANLIASTTVNTEPSVNGDIISWPSGDYYQVQRLTAQGDYGIDYNVL